MKYLPGTVVSPVARAQITQICLSQTIQFAADFSACVELREEAFCVLVQDDVLELREVAGTVLPG